MILIFDEIMDLSKLKYFKTSPSVSPRNVDAGVMPEKTDAHKSLRVNLHPSYAKEDGVLSTALVLVLSGGTKRESDFLRELRTQRSLHSLRVLFVSKDGQGLNPRQMQQRWAEIQNSKAFDIDGQTFRLGDMDKVFLLSDVDEFYNQLLEVTAEKYDDFPAQWIISNPCFEIWLCHCYSADVSGYQAELESLPVAKRSQRLKALGNDLVPGGLNPCKAFELMRTGISISENNYREDANRIPQLFSTQMHIMARYILDKVKEYSDFVERKAARRKTIG